MASSGSITAAELVASSAVPTAAELDLATSFIEARTQKRLQLSASEHKQRERLLLAGERVLRHQLATVTHGLNKPPTPGPGWYDVAGAAARSRRRTALSSSFVSKTERKFLPKGSDAPGPAYYAPRRNRDSSFVLNDTGRWV